MIYKFNTPLLDMDGNASIEMLHKILANLLMQAANTQNPLKFFEWAIALNSTGEIHLDSTDKELMLNFIKGHEQLTVLGKGRLMEVLK
jgi:hypothetical protein